MNFNRENNASCNFIFEKKKDEYDSHSNHSNLCKILFTQQLISVQMV